MTQTDAPRTQWMRRTDGDAENDVYRLYEIAGMGHVLPFPAGLPSADVVRAEVSRLVVDVERFADDRLERCAAVGMGATYVRTCAGNPLRALSPRCWPTTSTSTATR